MADDQDDAQKTEEPSQRKLQKAREQGQTAVSQEAKHWGILLAATIAMATIIPWSAGKLMVMDRRLLELSSSITLDPSQFRELFADVMFHLLIITAPFLGVMVVAAIASAVLQTGLIWAPDKLAPKLGNISITKGFGRLFSTKSVVELFKGAAKLLVIALVSYMTVMPWLRDIALMPDAHISESIKRLYHLLLVLMIAAIIVMTVVAAIDYVYQRYTFIKQMRMTKQEVKDEHKQSEGDPQVKARIRQLRSERSRQRMMAAVPDADVVVTNPTHYAVALRYKIEEMAAPVVVAKGQDLIALRIREIAEENDVPIYESPPLARTLYAAVEIDQEIPTEHYQAVAEVIGFVMRMRGDTGRLGGRPGQDPPIN